MITDTIIYEKKTGQTTIAGLTGRRLSEVEIINEKQAPEGNIYLGKITHKIDLANGKAGFFMDVGDTREAFINSSEPGMNELEITEGESLVVQVAQEQRAEKGARLTRALQLVGENLVYCPYRMNVEVSTKITDKLKADEVRDLVLENTTGQEGWVVRTSAVNVQKEKLLKEMDELRNRYDAVMANSKNMKAPSLLQEKVNPLWEFISRHQSGLQKIVVNSRNIKEELEQKYGDSFEVVYDAKAGETYGLEEAVAEALNPEISLPGGGRIFIEETKACVAIDVDSGDDKANGNLSRLNNDAAREIVRQIILRNLSGKIVIDFAGVSEYRFLKSVLDLLEQELKQDNIKNTFYGLSRGGNVEIVRARRRPSLRDVMTTPCESCQGTGRCEK